MPNNHAVGMNMPIEYVQPGYIIQMKLKSCTPHTAIVYNIGINTISFIESNWFLDETVHVRTIDFNMNTSNNPNIEFLPEDFSVRTIKDIKKGEELTVDYSTFSAA
jgi:hypothetical protein